MTAAIRCRAAPADRQPALPVQIRIADAERGKSQVVALDPRGDNGRGTIICPLLLSYRAEMRMAQNPQGYFYGFYKKCTIEVVKDISDMEIGPSKKDDHIRSNEFSHQMPNDVSPTRAKEVPLLWCG